MQARHSHPAIILLVFSALLLPGCATAPVPNRIERPWSRIDSSPQGVPLSATVCVTASGDCESLLGDQGFLNRRIANGVLLSLTRRGYVPDSLSSQVVFRVKYRTTRRDYTTTSAAIFSIASSVTLAAIGGTASSPGPGVGLASAMAGIFNASRTTTTFGQQSLPAHHYTHAVSITADGRSGDRLWQAESTWESPEIDILEGLTFAVQAVVSSLPLDKQRIIEAPVLGKGRVKDYYKLNCSARWFTCPGLPYRIFFYDPSNATHAPPKSLHWEALPAFLDLIQHAEYALPEFDKELEKADLLSPETWTTMLLGGRYQLGQRPTPENVVVRMVARPSGYLITDCQLVTDAEYALFQRSMDRWQEKVRQFWDFYRH